MRQYECAGMNVGSTNLESVVSGPQGYRHQSGRAEPPAQWLVEGIEQGETVGDNRG